MCDPYEARPAGSSWAIGEGSWYRWKAMRDTNDFTIIPTLDLKDGIVVHAKSGSRADYRPVASPFGAADDPVAIARGLITATGSSVLYIADLDAITGSGSNFELVRGLGYALQGVTVWVDAGFSRVADCAFWLPLGATLVIGSESLRGADDWREIREVFDATLVLSLDSDEGGPRDPGALFGEPALWPDRIIAMNLSHVGTGQGPDIGGIVSIVEKAAGRAVFAAGGVRDARDLAAIEAAGAKGALVATALHTGAITQKEIAALLRERRS
jgi:phosphoribosylformimino-5-aminoimidazole carboxamide ribotide isomerase